MSDLEFLTLKNVITFLKRSSDLITNNSDYENVTKWGNMVQTGNPSNECLSEIRKSIELLEAIIKQR
ncbi:hypothetical protein [Flavobacterium sp.]|uniref:hypothetical protein n=1 Tax=Flavobacterium sp. TaxID=239 RepID=UPI00262B8F77|nr:hypothetical protein [Flavobacterium sp.]